MRRSFYGVHPDDCKSATNGVPIEVLPVNAGDRFNLSLTQHAGVPAKPVVTKGQEVRAGELIAEAGGFISAGLHSPVSGVVKEIAAFPYPVSGIAECIVIEAGENQEEKVLLDTDISLAELAKQAGIVGMGGAMFPTHVKLSPREQLHTLIINGIECEPYLTCDHRLMLEKSSELIKGAYLIKDALKLDKIILGIEANKPDAAHSIRVALQNVFENEPEKKNAMEIVLLPMIYPQGGEKQLIFSITGREVPEGKLPSELGVIVDNVSTVLALYDAYTQRIPLIKRVVTVTGDINIPKNILAPLGTPISRLIEFCGGATGAIKKIVLGGPMTGFAAHSLAIPSYKGMNGIIVSAGIKLKNTATEPSACIRCGRCVRACPAGLSPVMLENYYRQSMFQELFDWKVLNCIECSCCNYVCPASRPLKTVFRLGKNEARAIAVEMAENAKQVVK